MGRMYLASQARLGPLAMVSLLYAVGAAGQEQVVRVPVSGVVEMGLAPFIERTLEEAAAAGVAAVVLDIDTPGGRVDSAERITNAIGRSGVPVYAWVNMHAYSAGAMIALATEGVLMQEGAVMGAATPVDGSGTKASEKIVSAMRAQMRALTEARGLDPVIAEAMVDEDIAVEGVVEEGKLLTLTTGEAVALGYAVSVDGWEDVLAAIGVEEAAVVQAEVNWAERIVRFFTNPVIAPFLLSLGFLGLLVEIKTAGFGLAGGAGILSLALFFGAHLLVGLAGAEDLILVAAGIVLILVEVFVIPGFGIFGIAGGLALLGGLFMAQIGSLPSQQDLAQAATVIGAAALLVILTSWVFLRSVFANRRLGRSGIVLPEATDREEGYTSADLRPELVGLEGVAITSLRPAGVGLFADERVDVVSESEWIEEGTPIRIMSAEGYRHVVRAIRARQISNQT
ncbi:MAG: nodulation protein NfeD [Gemmatimonadetes bacterium]|nr:nodulation protein NfeD [Gemmatimonadota bacterium]MYG22835.1 nodulation protein NfeD [Gemmatimonadota bacterium]MYJ40795.1 nodulation protein NfeD [Gemmatimonadota bacterium]